MTTGTVAHAKASFARVCVVGLGYIGLPTAAFFASTGLNVLGVDVNESHVQKINDGKVPFFEPDFESLLVDVVSKGKLQAATEPAESDAYIIAVPTPFNDDHTVDLKYIESAAKSVAPTLRPGALVVLESTAPPGTTEKMAEFILEARPDLTTEPGQDSTILVAHCPERVIPGRIMAEMATNDRVIGGMTPEACDRAKELYATFCTGELLSTNAVTAEMAKLTENSFRDVNIAFANELSVISNRLGIDVWELIDIANHHPRVNILQPGPGVGGHCIAVDPWFIVSSAPKEARLIQMARTINDAKPDFVIDQVKDSLEGIDKPVIAALGIAFKADIDDLRESPSLRIVERLVGDFPHAEMHVVEPNVEELPDYLRSFSNAHHADLESALEKSDVVLVLVDHTPFKKIESKQLEGKKVLDFKGILPVG